MTSTSVEPTRSLPIKQEENYSFSLVIPCYNEEDAIVSTVEQIESLLEPLQPFELIMIDDGSKDRTGSLLDDLASARDSLRIIHHEKNKGYGAALKSGVVAAKSDLIGITDADGTYPTKSLIDLLTFTDTNDMVVGARTGQNVEYSKIRKIPKVFLSSYASWIAGQRIPDLNSGMRVFKRELALRYLHMLPDGFSFTTTITLAHMINNRPVYFHPIDYKRRIGKSKIQPIRDTLRFVQLIARMGMYFAPLRVLAPIVFVLSILFFGSLIYDVFYIKNLTDKTVMLLMFTMNTAIFGLLADMIDKRTRT